MRPPLYILGPCAAESEEQLIECARAIVPIARNQACDTVFRAGIWKPRTSPSSYQGAGEKGLLWLQRVQQECHLATATEVTNPEQVRLVIDAGIPYIWLGARTSANPVMVQEIADTIERSVSQGAAANLRGIMIKNPVNEDAALWVGNIERLQKTGKEVIAIHRGCNHHPCWQMAYDVRRQCPDTRLLLDPSHMSGDARQVQALWTKGHTLGYDGWMIEVHPHPEKALSDAQQQLLPTEVATMLNMPMTNHAEANELTWLRAMMDETDDALWNILNRRMDISRRIGRWKKKNNMPIVQPERYQDILQSRSRWASEHGISSEAVAQIMDAIHKESVKQQA